MKGEACLQEISIQTRVLAPVEAVWNYWNEPEHIMKWNTASEDWHTIASENDLRVGGHFSSRMEAKDGSMGFDFGGIYDEVHEYEAIAYTLGDGRKVSVTFIMDGQETVVTEVFEAEAMNPAKMQQAGWQSILNHFKTYVEALV